MEAWHPVPETRYIATQAHIPPAALEGVEGWKHLTVRGTPITAVPHEPATWGLLRQRGLVIPPPLDAYDWPGEFTPRDYQRATVGFLTWHDKAFCLNGLRTGKTLCAIWGADLLRKAGLVRRVAIVAPKFICDIVWERALFQTVPTDRAIVLTGTRDQKQKLAADTRFDYVVVNPESLHLVVDHLVDVDLIVVDEFTRFKTVRTGGKYSRRYVALQRASQKRRLWLLSGTPNPQAPTDAYGPIRLVNPRPLGFTMFREMTMMKVSDYKWVPRFGAADTVAEWMTPAIRFKREDCIDIPEVEVSPLEVELTKEQLRVIKGFVDSASAQLTDGTRINAPHAAAALMKCLQVMAGGVYGDDPNGERATHAVDATPTLEAIDEEIREADGPVIVFASYQCSVDTIAEYLAKQGHKVGKRTRGKSEVLHKAKRESVASMELFDTFQRGGLDVLVAIPQCMQFGLELTASNLVLWASPPFSFETYEQANARVQGGSQKRKVMIRHLVQNTLAKDLYHRLESREELQNTVLNLIENRTYTF